MYGYGYGQGYESGYRYSRRANGAPGVLIGLFIAGMALPLLLTWALWKWNRGRGAARSQAVDLLGLSIALGWLYLCLSPFLL